MVNGMVYFRDIHPILVGGLEHFFPYIGNNTPIWLIFFQRGLKPSTRISVLRGKMVIKPQISRASLFTMQTRYTPNCGDLIKTNCDWPMYFGCLCLISRQTQVDKHASNVFSHSWMRTYKGTAYYSFIWAKAQHGFADRPSDVCSAKTDWMSN